MWVAILIVLVISGIISWIWVGAIDKQIKYKKENPEYNEKEGWLDWDCNNSHTESDF